MVTCWERANLLALLCVMFFFCIFVTFPCGVLGQVWYLIVSIPDLCILPYFHIGQIWVENSVSAIQHKGNGKRFLRCSPIDQANFFAYSCSFTIHSLYTIKGGGGCQNAQKQIIINAN